jgi:hypothetical protein
MIDTKKEVNQERHDTESTGPDSGKEKEEFSDVSWEASLTWTKDSRRRLDSGREVMKWTQ